LSQRELLRERYEQHKPKNTRSKNTDKAIYSSMEAVIEYLHHRFKGMLDDYEITFEKNIKIDYMIKFIKQKGIRLEFDYDFEDRKIIPDGGVLFLNKKSSEELKKPLLISEIKVQGTNKKRLKEGKKKQATGNAIERLGKNLTGIKAMMNHEKITPFVCFGQGCDFAPEVKTVLAKVHILNEFYDLNRTHVFKKDGNSDNNYYSPVSMYFREEEWSEEEMFDIMKEIAETALRYYIF
jgi:type II restriction enzyme